MNRQNTFWFVWCPSGRAPTYKHETEASAIAEAQRLARLNEGSEFVVLSALKSYKVDSMQVTVYNKPDDIPF